MVQFASRSFGISLASAGLRWTLALVTALHVERQVVLEFQSNWLASGARLDVQELRAGYAEVPQEPSMINCLPCEGIWNAKFPEVS